MSTWPKKVKWQIKQLLNHSAENRVHILNTGIYWESSFKLELFRQVIQNKCS